MKTKYKNIKYNTHKEAWNDSLRWSTGYFNYLLTRTNNKFFIKKNTERRILLESKLQTNLPLLNDTHLEQLYNYACSLFLKYCFDNYDNSGIQSTPYEKTMLKNLENIISENKDFKSLNIYPYCNPKRHKPVIGCHMPDFLIFGLKEKKYSALVLEVDGDSHVDKYSRDINYYNHLKELGILVIPIPNEKASDQTYLKEVLNHYYRKRSGALDKQSKYCQRLIWAKTIACQMSLDQIDDYCLKNFNLITNLSLESKYIIKLSDCPRIIKKEFILNLNH